MQRAERAIAHRRRLGRAGGVHGAIGVERSEGVQPWFPGGDPVQHGPRDLDRRGPAGADQPGLLGGRQRREVGHAASLQAATSRKVDW